MEKKINLGRGQAISVRINPRMARKMPCLAGHLGKSEIFVVRVLYRTIPGLLAYWQRNPLVELRIFDDEL